MVGIDSTPLVTVVVPVYQVEAYLDACLTSIVQQTYATLEIILVDDGSTDGCPALCDGWAARDPRIRVIHQQNAGLSAARNAGLDVATGQYVCFVDSDDTMAPTMVQDLLEETLRTDAKITVCSFDRVDGDGNPVVDEFASMCRVDREVISGRDALLRTCASDGVRFVVVWNKLYAADLWSTERFPVGKGCEDEYVTPRLLARADAVACIPQQLYHYTARGDSLTAGRSMKVRINYHEAMFQRCLLLDAAGFTAEAAQLYSDWGSALSDLWMEDGAWVYPQEMQDALRAFRQAGELRRHAFFARRMHLLLLAVHPRLHNRMRTVHRALRVVFGR